MHFPLSDVTVFPLVPVVVAFCISFVTTPAGISGAFLLLPFQVSVLGYVGAGVTPTNLLFNVISTPGGIGSFRAQRGLDGALVKVIARGAVPAVILGSILRVTVFSDPGRFKIFAGFVLFGIGCSILVRNLDKNSDIKTRDDLPGVAISAVAAGAGLIGGVYGISGGSIIAPILVGLIHLPARRVAPAALAATLITSIAGVASFILLDAFSSAEAATGPDWLLALLLGIGGAAGSYAGARFSIRLPERALRLLLAVLACVLGITYVAALF